MASGWIYLFPDSDSDDNGYGPVTLPDGRLACYPHLNIICHKCCVDYSLTDPNSDFEEEDDDDLVEAQEGGHRSQSPVVHFSGPAMEPPSTAIRASVIQSSPLTNPHELSRGPQVRRGTGCIFPTKARTASPTSTPISIFLGQATYANITRYIHRQDPQTFLIFTDGACTNNGQRNPRAGWAFVQGPRA